MATAHYEDNGKDLRLPDDFTAINWMLDNIQGTPVIVEGLAPLYHWRSRVSIYTGLPTVLGWDWHQTQQRCHEDFVAASTSQNRPPLRAVWCARAYREYEGIYDVSLLLVTQDRSNEALVSKLTMRGVAYDNALGLARRFMDAIQWSK